LTVSKLVVIIEIQVFKINLVLLLV